MFDGSRLLGSWKKPCKHRFTYQDTGGPGSHSGSSATGRGGRDSRVERAELLDDGGRMQPGIILLVGGDWNMTFMFPSIRNSNPKLDFLFIFPSIRNSNPN